MAPNKPGYVDRTHLRLNSHSEAPLLDRDRFPIAAIGKLSCLWVGLWAMCGPPLEPSHLCLGAGCFGLSYGLRDSPVQISQHVLTLSRPCHLRALTGKRRLKSVTGRCYSPDSVLRFQKTISFSGNCAHWTALPLETPFVCSDNLHMANSQEQANIDLKVPWQSFLASRQWFTDWSSGIATVRGGKLVLPNR